MYGRHFDTTIANEKHRSMEYYLYLIVLVGVSGKNVETDIIASSAVKVVETTVEDKPDLNIASSNINIGYSARRFGGEYYDSIYDTQPFGRDSEGSFGDKYNSEDLNRAKEGQRFDQGNPDVHGRIRRPCQAYDTFCIRKFFAEHSRCKISGRQVPEPLFRPQTTFNLPTINISAILENVDYTGLKDGRVAEFYINEVTDNLVIALDFDAVLFASKNVYVKYYHRGREPSVLRDFAGATFEKVTVTVVIPQLKDLRLDRAEMSTYANVLTPQFIAGPGVGLSTDPEVLLMFANIPINLPELGQDTLATEGIYYATNFIQYNICDFGLKHV